MAIMTTEHAAEAMTSFLWNDDAADMEWARRAVAMPGERVVLSEKCYAIYQRSNNRIYVYQGQPPQDPGKVHGSGGQG